MHVTIQLDLPEMLLNDAQTNGLLESSRLGALLAIELRRRKAAMELKRVLEAVRAQPGMAMNGNEITAEVRAGRASRAHEAGA